MRKEVVLAIIAGISIGLVVAFGSWKLTRAIKRDNVVVSKNEPALPKNSFGLSIIKPENYDVYTFSPKIEGLTSPNVSVVLVSGDNDYYSKSDLNGEFQMKIELEEGLSQTKIIVFDEMGNSSQKLINLVYSTEFSKYISSPVSADTSTEEAEIDNDKSIREKVMEKVNNLNNKPISYVGVITDITEETIQIKADNSSIFQISTADDTSYINGLKKNVSISLTDLAIGDFIVAMGFMNGNKVLNAKRILITSPLSENKVEVLWGKIESLSKTKITINKNNDETQEIVLPKKWNGPDVKDLEEGQEIIVVGLQNEAKFDLRSIFVIE